MLSRGCSFAVARSLTFGSEPACGAEDAHDEARGVAVRDHLDRPDRVRMQQQLGHETLRLANRREPEVRPDAAARRFSRRRQWRPEAQ